MASIGELHFGVLVATEDDERARRTQRLAAIEAIFDPLPLTVEVAREWGRLAATANVNGVPLLTSDSADFALIYDCVDLLGPTA